MDKLDAYSDGALRKAWGKWARGGVLEAGDLDAVFLELPPGKRVLGWLPKLDAVTALLATRRVKELSEEQFIDVMQHFYSAAQQQRAASAVATASAPAGSTTPARSAAVVAVRDEDPDLAEARKELDANRARIDKARELAARTKAEADAARAKDAEQRKRYEYDSQAAKEAAEAARTKPGMASQDASSRAQEEDEEKETRDSVQEQKDRHASERRVDAAAAARGSSSSSSTSTGLAPASSKSKADSKLEERRHVTLHVETATSKVADKNEQNRDAPPAAVVSDTVKGKPSLRHVEATIAELAIQSPKSVDDAAVIPSKDPSSPKTPQSAAALPLLEQIKKANEMLKRGTLSPTTASAEPLAQSGAARPPKSQPAPSQPTPSQPAPPLPAPPKQQQQQQQGEAKSRPGAPGKGSGPTLLEQITGGVTLKHVEAASTIQRAFRQQQAAATGNVERAAHQKPLSEVIAARIASRASGSAALAVKLPAPSSSAAAAAASAAQPHPVVVKAGPAAPSAVAPKATPAAAHKVASSSKAGSPTLLEQITGGVTLKHVEAASTIQHAFRQQHQSGEPDGGGQKPLSQVIAARVAARKSSNPLSLPAAKQSAGSAATPASSKPACSEPAPSKPTSASAPALASTTEAAKPSVSTSVKSAGNKAAEAAKPPVSTSGKPAGNKAAAAPAGKGSSRALLDQITGGVDLKHVEAASTIQRAFRQREQKSLSAVIAERAAARVGPAARAPGASATRPATATVAQTKAAPTPVVQPSPVRAKSAAMPTEQLKAASVLASKEHRGVVAAPGFAAATAAPARAPQPALSPAAASAPAAAHAWAVENARLEAENEELRYMLAVTRLDLKKMTLQARALEHELVSRGFLSKGP